MFATYVHHLDPIALKAGILTLRWYGLAYLGGFAAAYFLLQYLAKRRLWVLKADDAADFVAAAALFGVFLGGRLGYVLFYQILEPSHGLKSVLADPLGIFRVWDGGMSSHGGILGLVLVTWIYSRRKKVSWTGLGDGLCVVAPIGLFFGRLANFVNGELFGRVANGVSWAMKFPMAFRENRLEKAHYSDALQAVLELDPKAFEGVTDGQKEFERFLELTRNSEEVRQAVAPYLEPRHPSQLYEAALEGLALFSILWFVRLRFPKAPNGLLTGLFFGCYALFRIVAEQFREPDAALVWGITKGQFLSVFMFLFSASFLFKAWKHRDQYAAKDLSAE